MAKSDYPQIDKLKKKFNSNQALSLREACSILWLEKMICSEQYQSFAYWAKQNKIPATIKFKWAIWWSLFKEFTETDDKIWSKDLDLRIKVRNLGSKHILSIKL
jgi:hypothetical protein